MRLWGTPETSYKSEHETIAAKINKHTKIFIFLKLCQKFEISISKLIKKKELFKIFYIEKTDKLNNLPAAGVFNIMLN